MYPYKLAVSIRANHPADDLDFFATLLDLPRTNSWIAHEARRTPKGTPLGGVQTESYWCGKYLLDETFSTHQQIEDVLDSCGDLLLLHRSSLSKFFETGGTINCFIGLFGHRNLGFSLSVDVLRKFSEANVALQFDVYPD